MYWPLDIFYVPFLLFLKVKLVPANFTSHRCGAQHTSGRCIWKKVALHRQVPFVLMNGFQLASCRRSSEAHVMLENILFRYRVRRPLTCLQRGSTVSACSESLIYCTKCVPHFSEFCVFDWRLKFSGQGREDEFEFVVSLCLVHGRPPAAPEQTQLEISPQDLQHVIIRLEVWRENEIKIDNSINIFFFLQNVVFIINNLFVHIIFFFFSYPLLIFNQ